MTEREPQWGKILACGCALGYERCMDCRPGLHPDQEAALAITLGIARDVSARIAACINGEDVRK